MAGKLHPHGTVHICPPHNHRYPPEIYSVCEYGDFDPNQLCFDATVATFIIEKFVGWSVLLDIIFGILLAGFIWKFNAARRKKILLTILLCLGWLMAICLLFREITTYLWSADPDLVDDIQKIANQLQDSIVVIIGILWSIAPLFSYWKVWLRRIDRSNPEVIAEARAASRFRRHGESTSLIISSDPSIRQSSRAKFLPDLGTQRTFNVSFPSGSSV